MSEVMQTKRTVTEIKSWLVENIAERLDAEPSEIKTDEPITDLGLSSREAIMLSGDLEEWLGFELPPELLYEHPIIDELAPLLAEGPGGIDGASIASKQDPFSLKNVDSFLDLFQRHVQEKHDATAFIYLHNGEEETGRLSYAELDQKAKALASTLQEKNLEGERVLLLCPTSLEFIISFFGCLYAKVIAVPAFPPQKTRGIERIESIIQDAGAKAALVTSDLLRSIQTNRKLASKSLFDAMDFILVDEVDDQKASDWQKPEVSAETLAFLQYTSGSTGMPKGVMVAHSNILANIEVIRRGYNIQGAFRSLTWLPLYHDMGLIGHILTPIGSGGSTVLMTSNAFLEKPMRWLKGVSKYRVQYSTVPNFAFDLCVDKARPEDIADLDFSALKNFGNGAEPVRPSTLENFYNTFKSAGIRPDSVLPNYGMAEATLMITCGRPGQTAKSLFLDGDALERNEAKLEPDLSKAIPKVTCGVQQIGDLKIVDPDSGMALPDGQIGEIWVSGESVAQGYWGREELSEEIFRAKLSSGEGPYMRTGDLGFLQDSELYFTGRLKDLIIIRGRNHYPQDIEATIYEAHDDLVKDGAAAFSVEVEGVERLVIAAEVSRAAVRNLDADSVFEAIRGRIIEQHEVQVFAIELLSPGRLPRTTSGKTQRRASKTAYLDDSLVRVASWKLPAVHVDSDAIIEALEAPGIEALQAMDMEARSEAIRSYLKELISQLAQIPADEVDISKPMINLGLDSMHAIQLKGKIEQQFGKEIELTRFLENLSLQEIISELGTHLEDYQAPTAGSGDTSTASPGRNIEEMSADEARELLVDIDHLSPEEVERLLEKLSDEE